MLKYKIMYIAALLCAAAAFVYINTEMSLLLLLMLVAIPAFVRISLADNAGKISIECEIAPACVAGKEAKPMTVTIKNKSRLPMGAVELVLLCRNHMFGEEKEEKISLVGTGNNQRYYIPLNSDKCGRSSVELKEIYCCDMLNITRRRLDFTWKKNYTVYPPMPEVQLHAQKLLNAEFGGYNYDKLRKGNDNSEVFGIREYAEGDALNAAHWKLSAKADEIIIREWSRPNNFRIVFVFDIMRKDLTGKEVNTEVLKAIMGLGAATSQELMRQGIGHNALILNHGLQMDMSVHQLSDSTIMFDEMMSVVVPEESRNFADEFLTMDLHNRYSKLIYIGTEANAGMLAAVAAHMDVTAVAVSDEGESSYNVSCGYPMYIMSAQNIKSEAQFVEL